MRDHYLIHFVASGSGTFWTKEQTYTLGTGQAFIIFPDQVTTYRADALTPWVYAWAGYDGYDAPWLTRQVGLTRECPICRCEDAQAVLSLIKEMSAAASGMRLGALAALGYLYRFLALLGQDTQHETPGIEQRYYRKALWYVEGNYARPIHITEVADFVGLSRSQLFRVFEKVSGISPKATLTAIRLRHAQRLIAGDTLTLEEIASSVGMSSPARLGALFKAALGMTIGAYRKGL